MTLSLVGLYNLGKRQVLPPFFQRILSMNGRGVIIAIFDSGVDPAACGLHVNSVIGATLAGLENQ